MVSSDTRPVIVENIYYALKGDKHLFLNPAIPDWIVVNANAAYIFGRCDGTATVADLADHVRALGAVIGEDGIVALLGSAQRHGVIGGGPAMPHPSATPETPRLGTVHLKLTNDCNLRCSYCYARSGGASDSLSATELAGLAAEVAALSPHVDYVLSGGEPLLHPSCLDFAEAVVVAGNAVHLLTNGTRVDRAVAARIAGVCALVKISIDGITEATHAHTRGRGNHASAVAAVELLLEMGAPIMVAMTVTRANAHEVPAMAKRYGRNLTFQPFFGAGRGRDHDALAIGGAEYHDILFKAAGVAPMGAIERVLSRARGRGIHKCALGDSEISISEGGNVYPCQLMEDADHLAGNIRVTPLREIYRSSPVLRRARELTVERIDGCEACPVRLVCGGACRARAWHETGRDDVSGNFCDYERLAFINGMLDACDLEPLRPSAEVTGPSPRRGSEGSSPTAASTQVPWQ